MTSWVIETAVGALRLTVRQAALVRVEFVTDPPSTTASVAQQKIADDVRAWVDGATTETPVPLDISSEAPFEQAVLGALLNIPRGETRSYADIAAAIGMPQAAQAVGNAVGRNPLPVVIPCHRVIRSDGSLGGFSGPSGMKRRLLAHEGVHMPEQIRLEL